MGRLENIIERNQRPSHYREKLLVWLPLGVIGIVLLVLTVCTDLGMPPVPANAGSAAPARPADRVDGVLLRSR